MEKQIKIALAGNPNSGKTTLFNALTGSNQFVGNWPGVTVEKKEGKLKKHDDVATHKGNLYIAIHAALQEGITINSGMLSNQYSIARKIGRAHV